MCGLGCIKHLPHVGRRLLQVAAEPPTGEVWQSGAITPRNLGDGSGAIRTAVAPQVVCVSVWTWPPRLGDIANAPDAPVPGITNLAGVTPGARWLTEVHTAVS